ncbi:hypothetical protein U1Q18_038582 [Sarracenia purpurea var. burkii]
MELNTIKDAFDRVTKKQKLSSSKSQEVIEQLGHEIEQAVSTLQLVHDSISQPDHRLILAELKTKLNEIAPLSQLEATQKELNIALSKYPKLLEKSFNPDISKAYRNVDFDSHTINQIIANHLYCEGLFDLGDCFINEANETEASAMRIPFLEMYQILDAFEEILQNRGRDEALNYARTFLAPFASDHMAEVQKLMACLLWAGKLDSSPYSELLSPSHWDKLAEELNQQFCNILGQSCQSP